MSHQWGEFAVRHQIQEMSPALSLVISTSWLAPASWQTKQKQAIFEAVEDHPDWHEYLQFVQRHRVAALSWAALQAQSGLDIPAFAREELRRLSDASRRNALHHAALLAEVLKAFNKNQIPVMPLKGPLLSYELYQDLGLRQIHDLDIACPIGDFRRAQECLQQIGWTPAPNLFFPRTPGQWKLFMRYEHHLSFVRANGSFLLELHWRNHREGPEAAAARWQESTSTEWQGLCYLEMQPTAKLLYLCEHGSEHAWFRAKWLGDIMRLHANEKIDWKAAIEEARRNRNERPLLICHMLLNRLYGADLPDIVGADSATLPRILMRKPLIDLSRMEEVDSLRSVDRLIFGWSFRRYMMCLHRGIGLRQIIDNFAFSPEDIPVLKLPDHLLWAYLPLRPFLWIWRRLKRIRSSRHPRKFIPDALLGSSVEKS